eukprot:7733749-Pyramimonas_sp.AAC.1
MDGTGSRGHRQAQHGEQEAVRMVGDGREVAKSKEEEGEAVVLFVLLLCLVPPLLPPARRRRPQCRGSC